VNSANYELVFSFDIDSKQIVAKPAHFLFKEESRVWLFWRNKKKVYWSSGQQIKGEKEKDKRCCSDCKSRAL
jgi:hypothetical protein